ncbi:MAG: flagellar basal-body rod protein FlgG, partial [Pseudomonadota bacterium]
MQALKIAATGMAAQQMRVDVTANNIANMSTTGYDARRASFVDLHYQQQRAPGTLSAVTGERLPVGVELGLGTRPAAVAMEPQQGTLRATGASLDLAIEGGGYFEITLPSGASGYTRDGGLRLSPDGEVVNGQGFPLAAGITVPQDARRIEISGDGVVSAVFDEGGNNVEEIGNIQIVRFVNPAGLEALGDSIFVETVASGDPVVGVPGAEGRGTLRQGFLEDSSVDVVAEITELIEAQRGYELNARVLSSAAER